MPDTLTFWAIACMHTPPQPGLKLLAKFSTSKETTPETIQAFAKAKLDELKPDQTAAMTLRLFPVEESRYGWMKPFDGKSYTIVDGHLRLWKAPKPPEPPPTTIIVRPPARHREEQNARKLHKAEGQIRTDAKTIARLEKQLEAATKTIADLRLDIAPVGERSAKTKLLIHDIEIWSRSNLNSKQHATLLMNLERIRRIHREKKVWKT